MKKTSQKLLTILICLLSMVAPVSALDASAAPKNKLVGTWTLTYEGNTYYKHITDDGRFFNLAPDKQTGAYYISRQGTYTLEDKDRYVETITHQWGEAIAPDRTEITYSLKKKELTLDFQKYGQQMHELWQKGKSLPEYKAHK